MKQIPGYEIREMEREEFMNLWMPASKDMFVRQQIFMYREVLTAAELEKQREVAKMAGTPYGLYLGVFTDGKFVGWAWGYQEGSDSFYMCNSAVLPEHRRKGIYSLLLDRTVETVIAKGFQRVFSRHNVTNNPVIIPKLKYGFTITSIELSDVFGTLVHLSYLADPLRRKVLDYRAGQIRADEDIERAFAKRKN